MTLKTNTEVSPTPFLKMHALKNRFGKENITKIPG